MPSAFELGGTTSADSLAVDSTDLTGTGTTAQAVLEELDDAIENHLIDTVDAHDATAISIADAGLYYTGGDVETALQEIGAGGIGGGGGGSGEAVVVEVTQTAHGLAVGDVLYHNGTSYVEAKADSASRAEVVGIVSAVADANTFNLHVSGYVEGLSGLTAGVVYFLSDSTSGLLTATEPTTHGSISKPLLVADSATSGWFNNWRGAMIGSDVVIAPTGVRAKDTDGQTITTATMTAVALDGEDFDTDAFHDTVTNNSRLTVPSGAAGYYSIVGQTTFANDGASPAGIRLLRIRINGTTIVGQTVIGPVSNETTQIQAAGDYYLAVNDYVELVVYHTKGSDLALVAGSSLSMMLNGIASVGLSGEFDYAEITSDVSVTATAPASANTVITGGAVTYDGATQMIIEFFAPSVDLPTANSHLVFNLWDGSTDIGRLVQMRSDGTGGGGKLQAHGLRRLTPSAGSHTYSVKGWVTAGTGAVDVGTAGTDTMVPGFLRQYSPNAGGIRTNGAYSPPRAKATRSAVQSIPNGAFTDVLWTTEEYDTASMHSTSVNTERITITEAGTYRADMHLRLDPLSGNVQSAIKKNGGTVNYGYQNAAGTWPTIQTCFYLFQAVAGDYISCEIYQNSGSAKNLYVDSYLAVTKIDDEAGIAAASPGENGIWQAYTPTLVGTTTNPTLGTGGSATGRYTRIGDTVIGNGLIQFGSAGTSAGAGSYRISLPVAPAASSNLAAIGAARLRDSSASTKWNVTLISDGVANGYFSVGGGATDDVDLDSPTAWSANDNIGFNFIYEAA